MYTSWMIETMELIMKLARANNCSSIVFVDDDEDVAERENTLKELNYCPFAWCNDGMFEYGFGMDGPDKALIILP